MCPLPFWGIGKPVRGPFQVRVSRDDTKHGKGRFTPYRGDGETAHDERNELVREKESSSGNRGTNSEK